jgi:ABC transporter substrate binding protein (PQQ-dependent alcohol dehydrogenase system)
MLGLLALSLLSSVNSKVLEPSAMAQEAGLKQISIVYLAKSYEEPTPPSLMETIPIDQGVAGAKLATQEINTTGKFLGVQYTLNVVSLAADAKVAEQAQQLLASGPAIIVADLDANDLLALADLPAAKDALILDMRTIDDRLRQEDCRKNIFHLLPDRAMRTDALAQFLATKRWNHWFVLKGPTKEDDAYADDIRRSATRFGGHIVDTRTYNYNPGARRVDTGFQQIQTQMPLETQSVPYYDVLFVADETDLFGDYLPYNTYDARPIVGTQGLLATAWHPSFQEYSSLQMQHRFRLFAHRGMTERDYGGWLAVRIVGEAVIRSGKTSPAELHDFLRSSQFEVAGFKGEGMTFRNWDQQLRQPVLLAQALMVVSMSPKEGFLHPTNLTDTLGFDEPETKCHFKQ